MKLPINITVHCQLDLEPEDMPRWLRSSMKKNWERKKQKQVQFVGM